MTTIAFEGEEAWRNDRIAEEVGEGIGPTRDRLLPEPVAVQTALGNVVVELLERLGVETEAAFREVSNRGLISDFPTSRAREERVPDPPSMLHNDLAESVSITQTTASPCSAASRNQRTARS